MKDTDQGEQAPGRIDVDLGLAPERIEDLKTIVAEAVINAMQHGRFNFLHNHSLLEHETLSIIKS